MAYKIGVISQKGGVGKSTISRLIATQFAGFDGGTWSVKIADTDVSQGTSFHWMQRRVQAGVEPAIRVESYPRVTQAIKDADQFDVMVLDGAPHSTADTLKIALASDVVIIPTGTALDDLEPSVRLAHELKGQGVVAGHIVFGLTRTGDSEAENQEAREYIKASGYRVAEGSLPERTGYRRASDTGLSVSETPYTSLNDRAGAFFQSLMAELYKQQETEEGVA
ncbi:MAG: ParA family protein [Mariprofundaceae bacterium]|nr:ParA family protein [Mariprofundaceae bacterium]